MEDRKTGNYGVRVVGDVCQLTQRVQVLVHITPIIKGKRKKACVLRMLTPLVGIFAVVGSGAARAKGKAYCGKTDRVHQQTQRVQVLVNGQDKEAECFWIVRPF